MKHYNISNRKSVTMRIRITAKMKNDIKAAAEKIGCSESRIIRTALNTFLYYGQPSNPGVIFVS